MVNNYILEFNDTGNCTLNVPLVCKNWNSKFFIHKTRGDKYIFEKVGKPDGCRCDIWKDQADEIIGQLGLIFVEDSFFKKAGEYQDVKTAQTELNRLTKLYNDKVNELKVLDDVIQTYIAAL